jgi:hypothetical protein
MSRTASSPSLSNTVLHIIDLRSSKEVIRPYARFVVTSVTAVKFIWNLLPLLNRE